MDKADGDGKEGKRLHTTWLYKVRCGAREMDDNGKLTDKRCDTYSAIGTDYCYYHLKHYFGIILRQTDATQADGRKYPELGVFAYYSNELDDQKGDDKNTSEPDTTLVANETEPVTNR